MNSNETTNRMTFVTDGFQKICTECWADLEKKMWEQLRVKLIGTEMIESEFYAPIVCSQCGRQNP